MNEQYKLSRWGRAGWVAALVAAPVLSAGIVYGVTDDGLVRHENSQLAQLYAAPAPDAADGAGDVPTVFPTRYGRAGGTATLVLYDDQSSFPEHAEMYAIATANLATHFGEVEIMTLDDYGADVMAAYDAAIFVGTDHRSVLPQELLDDVREATVPVMWIGQNDDDLVEGVSPTGQDFITQYGWDPNNPVVVASESVQAVEYKDRTVERNASGAVDVNAPRIVEPGAVEVLVTGICGGPALCGTDDDGTDDDAAADGAAGEVPWVVRSGNLTYVPELPLHYIDENPLYLVFADLYYDLLAPGTEPVRQAAVRFEDVGPEADPEDLRRVADYLAENDIPFQVAVVPVLIDRTPDREDWYGLSLLDAPRVVDALRYMQERGGTLIQHGTTHQLSDRDNPYSGRSGEDYEFYRYGCSATELPPYEWEGCRTDSWVRKIGPVAQDSVSDHMARMEHGRQIMVDAGLGEPTIFETPHYTASVNAYAAMAQMYDARYEQVEYYAGMISSGQVDPDIAYGQIFPYSVHDIYGSTVYPENLQNVTEAEQNNHAVRTPQTLIARAEANLVVRESTASFYFHPYLDIDYLKETVEGIEDLGYTFVPVTELR